MNHHNLTMPGQSLDLGRQSLIQCVAGVLRDLMRLAETGATQSEMIEAAIRAGADCRQTALDAGPSSDAADVVAILRRLLRKEARRRWEMSGEQEREGNGNAALGHRKVSILLDASADALDAPLAMSRPAATTEQALRGAAPERFGRSNIAAPGATLVS